MRKVLRNNDSLSYWDKRWGDFEADDDCFQNMNIYPIKYVDRVMDKEKDALDAGCGLGRVVKHYHNKGYKIAGCDYSKVAVEKLNRDNPELDICFGDILALPYEDESFDVLLVLGVIHSIEKIEDIETAINECVRCLRPGGQIVLSVRSDNFENSLIDYVTNKRGAKGNKFHKWCFKETEIHALMKKYSFTIERSELITNVPVLNKYKIFRKKSEVNEKESRSLGFQLNYAGNLIYKALKFVFSNSFGTTFVITARK